MPELPDVAYWRGYLARYGTGRTIRRVRVRSARVLTGISGAALDRALRGHRLEDACRRGKYLLARVRPGGRWLATHRDDRRCPRNSSHRLERVLVSGRAA